MTYETTDAKAARHRARKRMDAIKRIANGQEPKCAICGCPHVEILHIGHPNHDGIYHRRSLAREPSWDSRTVTSWALYAPIEEVLAKVQLECPYCNSWHAKFRQYPPVEKQPKWAQQQEAER